MATATGTGESRADADTSITDLTARSWWFVARKTATGRLEEGYPIRLQDPLPHIGLPLGPPRPELPLDLQSAFHAAYDLSIRRGTIRYASEPVPPPPLADADAAWMNELLGR